MNRPTRSPYYSTRIVIDMETLEVLEKDIVPYSGPWALAEGEEAPPDAGAPPADAGGADDGGAPPPDSGDDGGQPTESEILDGNAPPPTEGDEPAADPDAVDPDADPNTPPAAKPPTPQELAADATLKKAYRENFGQVKEILKANPALRPAFFKAAELNEIYPTVEDAKQAKDWAGQLYKFDNLYYSSKPEDTRAFLTALYENSLDEQGNAPHYERLAKSVVTDGLSNLYERVTGGDARISRAFSDIGLNGKQAMVAVQAVAAMLGIPIRGVRTPAGGGAPAPAGGPAAPGNMSEREQWLANEVARLSSEAEATKNSTLAQSEQNFYNGMQTSFSQSLSADIEKRLEGATALKSQKPGFQTWVKSQIAERTKDAIRADEFFASQLEAMSRSGNRGPEHQRQLVAALEQRARLFLPDALRDVLAEAGLTITQKTNTARAQAGAPRREPVTGGTPGRLSKPGTPAPNGKSGESYDQRANRLLGIE